VLGESLNVCHPCASERRVSNIEKFVGRGIIQDHQMKRSDTVKESFVEVRRGL